MHKHILLICLKQINLITIKKITSQKHLKYLAHSVSLCKIDLIIFPLYYKIISLRTLFIII